MLPLTVEDYFRCTVTTTVSYKVSSARIDVSFFVMLEAADPGHFILGMRSDVTKIVPDVRRG